MRFLTKGAPFLSFDISDNSQQLGANFNTKLLGSSLVKKEAHKPFFSFFLATSMVKLEFFPNAS
jgi:hypothetical protein